MLARLRVGLRYFARGGGRSTQNKSHEVNVLGKTETALQEPITKVPSLISGKEMFKIDAEIERELMETVDNDLKMFGRVRSHLLRAAKYELAQFGEQGFQINPSALKALEERGFSFEEGILAKGSRFRILLKRLEDGTEVRVVFERYWPQIEEENIYARFEEHLKNMENEDVTKKYTQWGFFERYQEKAEAEAASIDTNDPFKIQQKPKIPVYFQVLITRPGSKPGEILSISCLINYSDVWISNIYQGPYFRQKDEPSNVHPALWWIHGGMKRLPTSYITLSNVLQAAFTDLLTSMGVDGELAYQMQYISIMQDYYLLLDWLERMYNNAKATLLK